MVRAAVLLAVVLAGCAPTSKCFDAQAPAPVPKAAAATGDAKHPGEAHAPPAVAIRIVADPNQRGVDVEIAFVLDPAPVELVVEAPAPGSIQKAAAEDAGGPLDVAVEAAGSGVRLRLAHAPKGRLRVKYAVAGTLPARGAGLAPEIDADLIRATGRSFLALPPAIEHRPVDVEVDVAPYSQAHVASSFGLGEHLAFRATGALLRDALYVSGPLGQARFESAEGHDEAAWSGYTAFDPRPIAADVAAFRTAAREVLKVPAGELATLLILVDDGRSTFTATRRATGVVVRLAVRDPWSGAMRIAVASEVLKRWIGGEVTIGAEPGHEARGFWFGEGVARALAREMLFRFGQITPGETAAEIDRLQSVARTSPLRALGNGELSTRVAERGALPLLVARGALYATRVDGLLRKKSGGKRTLEDVARALLARAREQKGPLPESAWLDAVRADLGDGEASAFASSIERGEPPSLPDEALGKCFSRGARRYVGYDLGFDLEATRDAKGRFVALSPAGPAARAGVVEGDVLVEAKLAGDDPDKPITLVVERGGAKRDVRYAPTGATARGEAWTRRRDVSDEECTK